MEAVALNKVVALFVVYLAVGLISIVGVASSKKVSRYDCLAWGGLLVYLAAFMLVPSAELQSMIGMHIQHGCEFDIAKRECGRKLTETDFSDLMLFKQYVLLLTFIFTFAIGGTGVNLLSQGVAGRGSFISEEAERKFTMWLTRVEKNQKVMFYMLLLSIVLSVASLFTVSFVVKFIS